MQTLSKFLVASLLACVFTAQAEIKTYNKNMGELSFSLDVPSGWAEREIEGGVQLSSPDKKTSLAVAVAQSGGLKANEISDYVLKETYEPGASVDCAKGICTIKGTIQGQTVTTMISTEGNIFYALSLVGENLDSLKPIIDSIK